MKDKKAYKKPLNLMASWLGFVTFNLTFPRSIEK